MGRVLYELTMTVGTSAEYCIQTEAFSSNLVKSLFDLKDSGELYDVTLVGDDGQLIKAHKLVLSASSPFFRNIFKLSSNAQSLFYIRGLSGNILSKIAQFLYTGEVKVEQSCIKTFLDAGKDLKIGLLCEENLSEDLENVQKSLKKNVKQKQKNLKVSPNTAQDYDSFTVEEESSMNVKQEPEAHSKSNAYETSTENTKEILEHTSANTSNLDEK